MKFKLNQGIARKAIAAGLTAAMAFGGIAPATMAFAAGTGNITIKNVEGNSTGFYAYQIFTATVEDDTTSGNVTGKKESDIAWASTNAQTTVVSFIKTKDTSYTGTTAQDAADWIQSKLTKTNADTAANLATGSYVIRNVDTTSIAYGLANALRTAGITPTSLNAGEAKNLSAGYYLIVSDASLVQDNASGTAVYKPTDGEVGTAPIFAVVGGSPVTVTEKAGTVTLDKQVSEDGTNFTRALDAEKGKTLTYKLDGTLPYDYGTFSTYHYKFTDTMGDGLAADADSVTVKVYNGDTDTTGTDITSQCTTHAFSGQVLTVDITDLKKLTDVTITKDSKIEVTYTAHLDPTKAVAGSTGNPNDVTLTYTRDPHTLQDGTTTPVENKVFTYGLKLVKRDVSTKDPLQNAKFTIQLTNADGDTNNGDTVNQYVQSDGTLGADAYEFTTDANGEISVTGLDAGTYTVAETSAPTGYTAISAPFTVKISSTINASTGTMTDLTNTVTTTDASHVIAGPNDGTSGDNALSATVSADDDIDADGGIVNVTVGDTKQVGLPLTGQSGLVATALVGGTIVAVSAVALSRHNKERDGE